ncbi:MAG: fumarylacetoacetate hydrolase family protein [Chloroflexota bacterium]|nr:fumarylacetoacetate hydrolase family protein [Chloroflexota bacterium]
MKIVRFAVNRKIRYGILEGESVREMAGTPFRALTPTGHEYSLREVRLLAPCQPSKIVCLGLNYRSHIEETKSHQPETPLLFIKPSTAVIGPEDKIIYPPSSTHIDYECELGVVIKKRASHVSQKEALSYVLGYTCVNDVTARDHQAKDKQWTRAKGFDTFAPVGPCIETDLDPGNVWVETFLNGVRQQRANTSDLLFGVPVLINFITNVMTLLPGDIIATGTPSGISRMLPGDTIEIKIAPIGTLRNYVIKG